MAWFSREGFSLRYQVSGEGEPTLVLIHEMGGTLETFDEVVELLGPGRRVLRFDLRGAGLSQKIRGVASLEELVDDLAALIAFVASTGPLVLCGCAVGAAVAVRYSAKHRERGRGLVLLSPALGMQPGRVAEALATADRAERDGLAATVDARLGRTFPERLRVNPARVAAFRARMLSNDPASYAALYRMLAQLDLAADLQNIACPTLVVAGSMDQARPPELIAEIVKAIPGAVFKVLETGHVMPALSPELVAQEIEDFLRSLSV